MTQPVKNNYYLDRYFTQPAPGSAPGQGKAYGGAETAAIDAGVYGYESSMGSEDGFEYSDSFEFQEETDPAGSFSAVQDFQIALDSIEEAIEANPDLKVLKGDVAKIRAKLKEASNPGLTEARRNLLLGEADAMMTELNAAMSRKEPLEDLEKQIEDLKEDIQAHEFPAARLSDKNDLLRKLEQATAKLDLKADEDDFEDVQEEIAGVEGDFEALKVEVEADTEEALNGLEEKSGMLIDQIEASPYLRDEDKENFKSQIETKVEELKPQLENGTIEPEDAMKEFDRIDFAAGQKARRGELAREFENLARNMSNDNHSWEEAKELARRVAKAVKTDSPEDWSDVKNYMNYVVVGLNTEKGNDIINGLLGAIYYRLAGKDEEKFNALLDLIPSSVRMEMERTAGYANHELQDNHGHDTEADKDAHAWFGSAADSIDALERSRSWSKDAERRRTRLSDNASIDTSNESL